MANVITHSPPIFNASDVAGTLKATLSYLANTMENIDFALGTQGKNGGSTAERLAGIEADLENMQVAQNKMNAAIAALEAKAGV